MLPPTPGLSSLPRSLNRGTGHAFAGRTLNLSVPSGDTLFLGTRPKKRSTLTPPYTIEPREVFSRLETFQDVLNTLPELSKYGPFDIKRQFISLPSSVRKRIAHVLANPQLTPELLQTLSKQRQLGIIEECGDLLFEFSTLRSLQAKVFPDLLTEAVTRWYQNTADRSFSRSFSFQDRLEKLVSALSQHCDNRPMHCFDEVGLSPELSKSDTQTIMALLLTNHGYSQGDPAYQDTKKRVLDEAHELSDQMNLGALRRSLFRLTVRAFVAFPWLPARWFSVLPIYWSRKALKIKDPSSFTEALCWQNARDKISGRNEFSYLRPDLTRLQRKQILKPFETLQEVALLLPLRKASS